MQNSVTTTDYYTLNPVLTLAGDGGGMHMTADARAALMQRLSGQALPAPPPMGRLPGPPGVVGFTPAAQVCSQCAPFKARFFQDSWGEHCLFQAISGLFGTQHLSDKLIISNKLNNSKPLLISPCQPCDSLTSKYRILLQPG